MKLFKIIRRGKSLDDLKIAASYINVSLETRDTLDRTLLHCAAEYGRADIAEWLLSKRAPVDAKDSAHRTPLHSAAQNGRIEVAELLLSRGAFVDASDKDGKTPLHLAANSGSREIILLLQSRGAVSRKCEMDFFPIHYAVMRGRSNVLPLFADTLDMTDSSFYTPLMMAVYGNKHECAVILVRMGANVTIVNDCGETALHMVRDVETAQLLVEAGADVNARGPFDRTPVQCAQNKKHRAIVKYLCEMGAQGSCLRRSALLACIE